MTQPMFTGATSAETIANQLAFVVGTFDINPDDVAEVAEFAALCGACELAGMALANPAGLAEAVKDHRTAQMGAAIDDYADDILNANTGNLSDGLVAAIPTLVRELGVIGFTYEAAFHCRVCAHKRFGAALLEVETADRERNPIGAVFAWDDDGHDEDCDDCGEELT